MFAGIFLSIDLFINCYDLIVLNPDYTILFYGVSYIEFAGILLYIELPSDVFYGKLY